MKFSVIIPLYNKENTIRRAIFSVLDQSHISANDVEIVVVDDGSTDNSKQQVRDIQKELQTPNIKLVEQKNTGVSGARNTGVNNAQSDYITFLDADDTYTPIFLVTINNLIEQFPECGLFATSYFFVNQHEGTKQKAKVVNLSSNSQNQILPDFFLSAANGDLPFCCSSICIKKDIFMKNQGFPEGENMGEDQSLYCQLALKYSFAYSVKACANYFQAVQGSLMQTQIAVREMPFSQRLQTQIDQQEIIKTQKKSIRKYIAGHLLDITRRNLKNGNIAACYHLLNDSRVKCKPLKWAYWYLRTIFVQYSPKKFIVLK